MPSFFGSLATKPPSPEEILADARAAIDRGAGAAAYCRARGTALNRYARSCAVKPDGPEVRLRLHTISLLSLRTIVAACRYGTRYGNQ